MTHPIPASEWEWYGSAGHFICGRWCRFHLATKVGSWLVSTVGEYVHPRHSGGSEAAEKAWLKDNWPGEDIGHDRKYETMVFLIAGQCPCGCGLPLTDGDTLAFRGYSDAKSAREGHMAECANWAAKGEDEIRAAAPGVLSEPPTRVVEAVLSATHNDLFWSCWDNGQHVMWVGYNDATFWSAVCDSPGWKTKTIEGRTYTLNARTDEVSIAEAVPA